MEKPASWPAGDYILQENVSCKKMYGVSKGILLIWAFLVLIGGLENANGIVEKAK